MPESDNRMTRFREDLLERAVTDLDEAHSEVNRMLRSIFVFGSRRRKLKRVQTIIYRTGLKLNMMLCNNGEGGPPCRCRPPTSHWWFGDLAVCTECGCVKPPIDN